MCGVHTKPAKPNPAIRAFAAAKVCCQPCATRGRPSSFSHNASGSSPSAVSRNSRARERGPIPFSARAAAERLGATLLHATLTPPGADLYTTYRALLDQPGILVFDRCYLSELVYGPLYRGHSRLTYQQTAALTRNVTERHGIFVHVTAPPEHIHRRLATRAEPNPPDLNEITEICARYDDLFRVIATLAAVTRIDTNHPNENP